jgi:hypothetical protein
MEAMLAQGDLKRFFVFFPEILIQIGAFIIHDEN